MTDAVNDPIEAPDGTVLDDQLGLLVLCCHPALTRPSQVALTLRAVGGLTTAQIAKGFLVPEATMAQRISRAKSTLRRVGARFDSFTGPGTVDGQIAGTGVNDRLSAALEVLHLVFTEGHAATDGDVVTRGELTVEAIRAGWYGPGAPTIPRSPACWP